jgi:uncharacterized protein (DUF169 family)
MEQGGQAVGLRDLLGLQRPPVALAFRTEAPAGVDRVETPAASGCAYWKLAEEGRVFYTEAADHYNCPVGAHTHGVDLPPDKEKDLQSLVSMMTVLGYIRLEEVPNIPRRGGPFGVAVYAPLEAAPCDPDVVLVRGNSKQMMLVAEAARAAGIGHEGAAMGRPACAMVPATLESTRSTLSLGCIGCRVYTGLADEEMYLALPGAMLGAVVGQLETILKANRTLETFHQERRDASI